MSTEVRIATAVIRGVALIMLAGAIRLLAQSDTLLTTGIWYSGTSGFGGLLGYAGSETYFQIVVPPGQSRLVVQTYGGEGDVGVYVMRGAHPTVLAFEAGSGTVGTSESATIENPTAGTYYVLLEGYGQGYLNVSIQATYLGASQLSAWVWAKGTENNDSVINLRQGNAVALDSAGSTYVAGEFWGTADFGPYRVVASATAYPGLFESQAGFLAKYDATGQVVWAVTNVGTRALAVAIGTNGSVYVTGDFNGTVRFSPTVSLTGRYSHNTFLAKYDRSSGALIWARSLAGSGDNEGWAVACDLHTGLVEVGGYDTKPTSRAPTGTMVARMLSQDPDGMITTENALSSTDTSYITGLAFDTNRNLYVAGAFRDTLFLSKLGGDDLTSGRTQNDVPTLDAFFFKLNDRGGVAWGEALTGNGTDDAGASIAVNPDGIAYGSGSSASRHFLARFAIDGTPTVLFTSSATAGADFPTRVVADGRGGVYWSGCFDGTFSITNANLASGAATGGYLFNINAAGNIQWALQRNDDVRAIAANVDGNLFLTGTYIDFTAFGSVQLSAPNVREAFVARLDTAVPLTFASEPESSAVAIGASTELSTRASGNPSPPVQWMFNGLGIKTVPNASLIPIVDAQTNLASSGLEINGVQPANAGLYSAAATDSSGTVTSDYAILGVLMNSAVAGNGRVVSTSIAHPNGNRYDQVVLTGPAATISPQGGRVTRTSFIDDNNDIVQVEFAGAGTLSLVLDDSSGPAAPVNYHQDFSYMKGHVGLVIAGADETTNVSIFTVGRATAFDPTGAYNILKAPNATDNSPANNGSSLFAGHSTTAYDGFADIAFVAILSANGKFGGLRASNAHFSAVNGLTGVYAPGVDFAGPVFVGDISAGSVDAATYATPAIIIGSTSDARITGGSLHQTNGKPVEVSGITELKFTDGSNSGGTIYHAQDCAATLVEDGRDITSEIVVKP